MKKIYLPTFLLLSVVSGWAQSFTVTGPRTFYSTERAHNISQYFNFDKGKLVLSTDTWHISFNNSAITFNTGVEGQILTSTSFVTQTTAPTTGYASTIDVGLGTGYFNYAGAPTHIVSPIPDRLIAVKLADGRYVKVELISYYKSAPINILDSTSADVVSKYYAFRYLVSSASSTDWSQQVTKISNLQSLSTTDFQMVNFAIADTTINSADRWNLKFKGTTIESNNSGGNVAQLVANAFNSITSAPAITSGSISWYNYDMTSTHVVSAKPTTTILFKDSLNRVGKIVIETYYKNASVCNEGRYYTLQYYYNPYGIGENTAGRGGSDLTTTATITQTVPPAFSLSSSALAVDIAGTASAETINITADDSWEVSTAASWITLAGTTTGSGNGNFTITVAANTGAAREEDVVIEYCNGATKEVTVSQEAFTTAINTSSTQRVNVYPNPSSEKFNIDLGSVLCDEVVILNLEGKQLMRVSPLATMLEINTQEWNKGVYFVRFASAEGMFYKMIEIQ
jgi:hypothetical protein